MLQCSMPATATDGHALPREIMIRPRPSPPSVTIHLQFVDKIAFTTGPGQQQSCTRARARAANCRTHRLACLMTPTFWSCPPCVCSRRSSRDDSTRLDQGSDPHDVCTHGCRYGCAHQLTQENRLSSGIAVLASQASQASPSPRSACGPTSWGGQVSQFVRAVPCHACWHGNMAL